MMDTYNGYDNDNDNDMYNRHNNMLDRHQQPQQTCVTAIMTMTCMAVMVDTYIWWPQ